MTPGTYNFEIYKGSTVTKSFVLSSEGFSFDDYDSVRMKVKDISGGDILVWDSASESTSDGSISITSSTTITLSIPASTTKDFSFASAGYDIELVKNETPEVVDKLIRGVITLLEEYTT